MDFNNFYTSETGMNILCKQTIYLFIFLVTYETRVHDTNCYLSTASTPDCECDPIWDAVWDHIDFNNHDVCSKMLHGSTHPSGVAKASTSFGCVKARKLLLPSGR